MTESVEKGASWDSKVADVELGQHLMPLKHAAHSAPGPWEQPVILQASFRSSVEASSFPKTLHALTAGMK